MSDRGSDYDHRRDRRRKYSSDPEDARTKKDRAERRRSFDRGDKNGGRARDGSRSDHRRRRQRSRSPHAGRDHRARVNREATSRSRSPPIRRRPPRDERKVSRRESRSPPPKRRRHDSRDDDDDDGRRHSNHYAESRRRKSSPHRHRRYSPSPPPPPSKRSNAPLPSQNAAFKNIDPTTSAKNKAPPSAQKEAAAEEEKQKPNYAPTGKLAAETNTVANTSIVLKYNEPPDARLPPSSSASWRLYVFKGPTLLDTIPLHERSCWLFGREKTVVDYPAEHPSVSKQHAVVQFRQTEGGKGKVDEWGVVKRGSGGGERGGGQVRPYVIDLESANGTWVNGERVPERRFVEVRSGDVVRFGESEREYVLMLPPKEPPKG